jgi:hypothetical protein
MREHNWNAFFALGQVSDMTSRPDVLVEESNWVGGFDNFLDLDQLSDTTAPPMRSPHYVQLVTQLRYVVERTYLPPPGGFASWKRELIRYFVNYLDHLDQVSNMTAPAK